MQNTLPFGTIIRGRYLVQEALGKGDFGAVYLLKDQHNNFNLLVLKEVINPNKHKLYRLSIEAMSLRLLHHQALPHVYNVISEGKHDRVYILMDYIEGPNVQMLRLQQPEKRFSLPQAMTIMLPIMEAVTYLHSQQPPIIHQDIKPTNIIVPTTSDRAVLVDYGIGKKYNLDSTNSTPGRSLTAYEAPEQYSEEPSTPIDIYGLGATFYTLLTGIVPVDALSRKKQLESKGSDPLEPVNKVIRKISLPVTESIHRAMSLNSNDRFSTVEQFVQALQVDPTWKLSPIEKREFDQALKAAPTEQMSSEPFIVSSTLPNSPIVPEQEEAVSVPPIEVRGVSEAEEVAPEPTAALEEEEARAEPVEVRGVPEAKEVAPEPTPVLEEEEAIAEPTEVRGVPEAEEVVLTPVLEEEEARAEAEARAEPAEVKGVPEAEEVAPAPVLEEEEARAEPTEVRGVPEAEEVVLTPVLEEEEARAQPTEVREVPEAEEAAPTPVLKEEEARAQPTEVRGMREAEEVAPEPTPVLEEEEARVEPTEVRGVPEAEEAAPTSVLEEEEAKAESTEVGGVPEAKPEETALALEPLVKPAEVRPVPEAEESRPAPSPVAKEEEIEPAAEPVAQQEAKQASAPVMKEEEIKPVPALIAEQPRNARSRKPGVLVLVLLALLVGIIIGSVFGAYAVSHYGPSSVAPTPSPLHKATPSIHTPNPTPTATTFTGLVGAYDGTIYNLATNTATKMSLTGIQQNRTAITGNFSGFKVNAPFRGSIDTSRHIRFIVIGSSGSATLSFNGSMQADGNLAGDYCNLNQQGRCSGGYGIWSVSPVHLHG